MTKVRVTATGALSDNGDGYFMAGGTFMLLFTPAVCHICGPLGELACHEITFEEIPAAAVVALAAVTDAELFVSEFPNETALSDTKWASTAWTYAQEEIAEAVRAVGYDAAQAIYSSALGGAVEQLATRHSDEPARQAE